MISLWISTAYLLKEGKHRLASLITALPAAFMTAVTVTYILMAEEGFRLPAGATYPAGILAGCMLTGVYLAALCRRMKRPVL